MRFLLGTDEAGYGPNLGPLVVAASAWQVPREMPPDALYDALGEVVCRRATHKADNRLEIADSKQLYQSGGSLAPLERGVLGILSLLGHSVKSWQTCWRQFACRHTPDWDAAPWHDGYDEPLPLHLSDKLPLSPASDLAHECHRRAVRPVALQAVVLSPRRFNDLCDQCGNKAEVLSLTTLSLARRLIENLPGEEPVLVVCDRHGGRARYAALLQHIFPDEPVRVRSESAELGVYDLRCAGRAVEFRFLVKGERMLPTALASMTAKYLRELALRPFNAFWQRHVPGLRATAGYAVDAKRFRAEIRPAQRRLGIDDRDLWRSR